MKSSEQLNELFEALSVAQGEICNAKKDSVNPFFKSKYADLAEVLNVSKEPLSANGLCVMQFPSHEGNVVHVETVIGHKSGQWMSSEVSAIADKMDVQTIGKLITYLRRYAYSAVVGIAQEDDDGQEATQKAPAKPPVKKPVFTVDKLGSALEYADGEGLTCEQCITKIKAKYDLTADIVKEIVKYYADKEAGE